MRFSAVIPTTVLLLAGSAFAQDTLLSALGSAATSVIDASASTSAMSETTTGTATDIVIPTSAVSSAMSSGTSTTTLGINGTSTMSGALPTGTNNGTNGTNSTGGAMGLGVHAAQYVLPGVAAIGAIAYSGFF